MNIVIVNKDLNIWNVNDETLTIASWFKGNSGPVIEMTMNQTHCWPEACPFCADTIEVAPQHLGLTPSAIVTITLTVHWFDTDLMYHLCLYRCIVSVTISSRPFICEE